MGKEVLKTYAYAGSMLLPGPEDLIMKAIARSRGLKVVVEGGKRVWKKIAGKGTHALEAAEEKAIIAEYNVAKAAAPRTGTVRNQHLAGSTHPKTGVPFNKEGFPVFESAKDVKLPKNLHGPAVSDTSQFTYATEQLAKELEANPALKKNFTQAQLNAIAKGEGKIPGYTWHHNEDGVTLQLVDSEIHRLTGHSGGRQLTGGRP